MSDSKFLSVRQHIQAIMDEFPKATEEEKKEILAFCSSVTNDRDADREGRRVARHIGIGLRYIVEHDKAVAKRRQ